MNIGIIVLNWNAWQDTLQCLDSLIKLHGTQADTLLVCDNNSTNESWPEILHWAHQHWSDSQLEIIEPQSPNHYTKRPFKLMQTGKNLGFAGGMNAAIRHLLAGDFDYLWLLNNDIRVTPDALDKLVNYARHRPEIAMFGVTVLEDDGSEHIQCAGGCFYSPLFTTVKHALQGMPLEHIRYDPPKLKLDYIFGAAMFCKVAVFKELGLFQEDYFLFYEELDYTQRLKRAGYDIAWCADARIYHKGSISVGKRSEGNHDKLKLAAYYENRNTFKYTARFHRPLLAWVLIFRFLAKCFIYLCRRDFYLLPVLVSAYRDFFRRAHHVDPENTL